MIVPGTNRSTTFDNANLVGGYTSKSKLIKFIFDGCCSKKFSRVSSTHPTTNVQLGIAFGTLPPKVNEPADSPIDYQLSLIPLKESKP